MHRIEWKRASSGLTVVAGDLGGVLRARSMVNPGTWFRFRDGSRPRSVAFYFFFIVVFHSSSR